MGSGMPWPAPSTTCGPLVSLPSLKTSCEGCGHPPFLPSRPSQARQGASWALPLQNSVLRLPPPTYSRGLFVPIQDAPGWPLARLFALGPAGPEKEGQTQDEAPSGCRGQCPWEPLGHPEVLTNFSSKGAGITRFLGL